MGAVTEVGAVEDDLSRRQLDILLLNLNEVAVFAELRLVEERDGLAELRETDELLAVDTSRIVEYTAAVDDCDGLVGAREDLV